MDGAHDRRPAGDVKRLGDHPIVLQLSSDGAPIEVPANPEDREQLLALNEPLSEADEAPAA